MVARILLFGILSLTAGFVHADEYVGDLEEVWANSYLGTDIGWLKLSGTVTTSCTYDDWILLDFDANPSLKMVFSVALTAKVSGRQVRIGLESGCQSGSISGYPLGRYIALLGFTPFPRTVQLSGFSLILVS